MIKQNKYWANRDKAEKAWQAKQIQDLDKYNKNLGELYQTTIDNINREIKADVSYSNGHLLKADKMGEYERLAKKMVAKADAMRAKGHHVTRKDFSKDVNDRLKIYNATMRINRNEILKSMIGEQLVNLGIDQEDGLTSKLWNDYTKEKERQAGILGQTTKLKKFWTNKEVIQQLYRQIGGANFSKRVWADIDGLKGTLDGLVATAIIRGDNPKEMAKWLTGMVSAAVHNQQYAGERLARTETARVQYEAAKNSILDAGYKYVKWYAEGEACKTCKEISEDDVGYGDGIYPSKEVPDIPVHPNCMCSIGAYWVEDDKKNSEQSKAAASPADSNAGISEDMLSNFTNDQVDEIKQALSNAPDDVRQMWNKYTGLMKIGGMNARSSYYLPSENKVYFDKPSVFSKGNQSWRKKYATLFHEFGHLIDYNALKNKSKSASAANSVFINIGTDYENLLKPEIVKVKAMSLDQQKKALKNMYEYFPTVSKKTGKVSLKYQKILANQQLNTKIRNEIKGSLKDKNDYLKTVSTLSDTLQAASRSKIQLGVGHSKKYYSGWIGDEHEATEWFANMTADAIDNPAGRKVMEKYMPESTKIYDEMVKQIAKADVGGYEVKD